MKSSRLRVSRAQPVNAALTQSPCPNDPGLPLLAPVASAAEELTCSPTNSKKPNGEWGLVGEDLKERRVTRSDNAGERAAVRRVRRAEADGMAVEELLSQTMDSPKVVTGV